MVEVVHAEGVFEATARIIDLLFLRKCIQVAWLFCTAADPLNKIIIIVVSIENVCHFGGFATIVIII